jgi:hypothetical protein
MPGTRQEPPVEAAEKQAKETGYIVLSAAEEGQSIQVLGKTMANGPEQAVRRKAGDVEGVFVAVPERNWTIVDQAAETPPPIIRAKTRKWGEAREAAQAEASTERAPDSRPPQAIDEPPMDESEQDEEVVVLDSTEAEALAAAIEDDGA